jgi:tRNA threonylcarbamoyladenosine biosynthesis protein TsaE
MSVYLLNNETETQQLAERMAQNCSENERLIIFLQGELGSGKTTFTRFFLQALGHCGPVKSPTYTLVETYQLSKHLIFHLDLYRLQTPKEIVEIGLYDEFNQVAIWLIEWPEQALRFLPSADISCTFTLVDTHRQVKVQSQTSTGKALLLKIKNSA